MSIWCPVHLAQAEKLDPRAARLATALVYHEALSLPHIAAKVGTHEAPTLDGHYRAVNDEGPACCLLGDQLPAVLGQAKARADR